MNPPDSKRARSPVRLDRTVIDSQHPEEESRTAVEPIKLGPGLRIEQYELIRELGRGGMGQVFLARDNRLGRKVAMKFLASNSPRFTERFKVEARTTAQVNHENIVVIHDVDAYLGLPYMVLEYVEGTTLTKLMAEKRLPVGRAVELIVPVVKALARAHEANIIHRDLKPDNVVVTGTGTVKVLDFGIAKLFTASENTPVPRRTPAPGGSLEQTRAGSIVGTLPYMSPEQLGVDEIDHRSDLWAVGIILYEMIAGKHPLEPVTQGRLFGAAAALDERMPSLGDDIPGLPDQLVEIVARCLAKRKTERYATAGELLEALEPLLPGRAGRGLAADESPYPGLTAFQESDANRFFGRSQDIAGMVARLRDQPLVAVVGPSGVGKSSFVRAGVVPALKASGDPWEVIITRPGRSPMLALASSLEQLRDSRDSEPMLYQDPVTMLRTQPGAFGARLRARARRKRTQILLFIDQHEELYTLVPDAAERLAFTACLAAAADDPSGPVRVVVSMRSDFLDRAAEDRRFVEELTRGLVFLQPPSAAGLEDALTQPLAMLGYRFQDGIVDDMLQTLATTPGSLPLLQFTAAKLWETRDKPRRVLTADSYHALGGVAGALATHADEVLAGLAAPDQKIVRTIFQRLVTPERTRAIVDGRDLRDIAPDVDRIVSHLVGARLLVVQTRGEGEGAVELVHESLITSWPTLRRWLEENNEDAAYLAQVRAAAKQWDAKGRPQGLLWRAEAMVEARQWRKRYTGELPPRERDYLDAVIALAKRSTRIKRGALLGTFAFLLAVIAAGGLAMIKISESETTARKNERTAKDATNVAKDEQAKAVAAKQTAEDERQRAETEKQRAETEKQHALDLAAKVQAQLDTIKSQNQTIKVQSAQVSAKSAEALRLAKEAAKAEREKAEKQKVIDDARRKKEERTGKISHIDLTKDPK